MLVPWNSGLSDGDLAVHASAIVVKIAKAITETQAIDFILFIITYQARSSRNSTEPQVVIDSVLSVPRGL